MQNNGQEAPISIPILKVQDCLIASIQVSLDDRAVFEFQNNLLKKLSEEQARGVVIDITAIDVVDSFMARALNDAAMAVQLLGARAAIVGIQPAVAITLVEMGLTIPSAITALNLEQALRLLSEVPRPTRQEREEGGAAPGRPGRG